MVPQLLSLVHLLDHLTCVCFESKELITQAVNESRKCPGISDCFLFGNVQIVVIPVNSLVTRKAASIRQSFHAWAKAKTFNLGEKVFSLTSGFNNQLFQANAKKGAGRSRGRVCDALSFLENNGNRFWHALRWSNSRSSGVNHLAVFPKGYFPAVSADFNEVVTLTKKIKKVAGISIVKLIAYAHRNPKSFTAFVGFGNQLIDELTVVPTAWAGECF